MTVRTKVRNTGRRRTLIFAGSGIALLATGIIVAQAQQVYTNVGEGAKKALAGRAVPTDTDQKLNLSMKIKQPFTVVAVGDLLEFQPFSKNMDPDIQAIVSVMKSADLVTGDLENELRDFDNFGHIGGNLATKEVADDWVNMNIGFVSRANNKQTDGTSVWEDFQQVQRVGITHAGVARSMPEARMARYRNTAKGLVGFIGWAADGGTQGCCSGGTVVHVTAEQLAQVKAIKASVIARRDEVETPINEPTPDPDGTVNIFEVTFTTGDTAAGGGRGGRGGGRGGGGGRAANPTSWTKNAVRVTQYHGVTAPQMAVLRAIAGDTGTGSDLHAFGTQFRVMAMPGEHSFDMNPDDLRDMMIQTRTGKQGADFLASNMHWHENRYDFQAYSYDHFPADFEIKFAHMAIDEGDDMFAAQGVHTIKGVEIYKGKPIFYGLSNFVFQSGISPRAKGELIFDPPGLPGELPGEVETGAGAASAGGRGRGAGAAGASGAVAGGRGGRGGRGAAAAAGDDAAAEDAPAAGRAGRGGGRGGRGGAPADPNAIVGEHEHGGAWQLYANAESLMAQSHYENGQLTEVRIYPLDLGQTPRPMSQFGVPKRPTPEVAKKILDELIEYSKPFGTKIVVENGVAVIRIPPSERQ